MASSELHLAQATHNREFHGCIQTTFNDRFYDWKITALFYTAIHWLKALAAKRTIDIGETHSDIARNVNPERHSPKMPISRNAWRDYHQLYRYSQSARYNGITDFETWEKLKEADHKSCLEHLENFKKYIEGQGLAL